MKKKRQYSLTAKERRELREKEKQKSSEKVKKVKTEEADIALVEESVSEPSGEGTAVAVEVKKRLGKKSIALVICAAVLAVAMIVIAIVLPFVINPYGKTRVAKIELSNGMVLEYELYGDTCPISTTNFVFLAKIGYFNNVIIFDNQNDWIRFGGYTNTNFNHRGDDKSFTSKLSGFKDHTSYPFGYRLKKDTHNDSNRYNEAGMLCFLYNNTATEFQMSAAENSQIDLNGTTYTPAVFGRYLNDKTLENLKTLAALPAVENSLRSPWRPLKETVVIKKVTVYNCDDLVGKNFNFEKELGEDVRYWTGGV